MINDEHDLNNLNTSVYHCIIMQLTWKIYTQNNYHY